MFAARFVIGLFSLLASAAFGTQTIIIPGELTEKDLKNGKASYRTHRIPFAKDDLVALVLISPHSGPELSYRFHPKEQAEDPKLPWRWCEGSSAYLEGTTAKSVTAKLSNGKTHEFMWHPMYETLVFGAPQDGILELKVECSKLASYQFLVGKTHHALTWNVIAKDSVQPSDPVVRDDARCRTHAIPAQAGEGLLIDVVPILEDKELRNNRYALLFPNGYELSRNRWVHMEAPLPIAAAATATGELKLRVEILAQQAKLARSYPYEVVMCRIPDPQKLLGIR